MRENKPRTGIQVIARAATILRVLKKSRTSQSLGQISSRVGLPRSTVQRIVGALADERFVVQDPVGKGVRIGPELGAFAEAANSSIVERCRAILSELTHKTGETTDLAVLRGNAMVFLDQIPGLHRLRTVSTIGGEFPLTTTANGRACLALMPEDAAKSLIEAEWARTGGAGNIVGALGMLKEIQRSGLAYDLDEHSVGISAVGFGFRYWSGILHAISVPVPSTRFKEVRGLIEASLLEAKKQVGDAISADSI